jgi:hypothetical protein
VELRGIESWGARLETVASTAEALARLSTGRFDAVIAMTDHTVPHETSGQPGERAALLEAIRRQGLATPFFVHSMCASAENGQGAPRRDGETHTTTRIELLAKLYESMRERERK